MHLDISPMRELLNDEVISIVAVQGFRVQGSKVRVQVQSKSLIDKPRGKSNKIRDSQVRWNPVEKNWAANFVNACKQR